MNYEEEAKLILDLIEYPKVDKDSRAAMDLMFRLLISKKK